MSGSLRSIAFAMLGEAHKQRNQAECRLWEARDDVTRSRLQFLEAQSREAIAQRDLDRAQEFLNMIWTDMKPLADRSVAPSDSPTPDPGQPVPTIVMVEGR